MLKPLSHTMKMVVAVAIDIPIGKSYKDIEQEVREAVLEYGVSGAKGVSAELMTWKEPDADDWWSRIIKYGDLNA